MVLDKAVKHICARLHLDPARTSRVARTLEHVEHSGGVGVGVEFLFHPPIIILAVVVASVWFVRYIIFDVEGGGIPNA